MLQAEYDNFKNKTHKYISYHNSKQYNFALSKYVKKLLNSAQSNTMTLSKYISASSNLDITYFKQIT